jgi:hypothetical protein
MSRALRLKRPEQTQPRAIVKERVAAWEEQKFNDTDNAWSPETFDVGEDDVDHSGDREDWLRPRTQDVIRASEKNQAQRQRPRREVVHLRVLTDARRNEISLSSG